MRGQSPRQPKSSCTPPSAATSISSRAKAIQSLHRLPQFRIAPAAKSGATQSDQPLKQKNIRANADHPADKKKRKRNPAQTIAEPVSPYRQRQRRHGDAPEIRFRPAEHFGRTRRANRRDRIQRIVVISAGNIGARINNRAARVSKRFSDWSSSFSLPLCDAIQPPCPPPPQNSPAANSLIYRRRLKNSARLTTKIGGPKILIKRDDQTGLALGGNKVRKLEFLLADALAQGCDTLITLGAAQSNHCRQTAAAAAACALKCELILNGKKPELPQGNLFLDELFGATIHWIDAPNALPNPPS